MIGVGSGVEVSFESIMRHADKLDTFYVGTNLASRTLPDISSFPAGVFVVWVSMTMRVRATVAPSWKQAVCALPSEEYIKPFKGLQKVWCAAKFNDKAVEQWIRLEFGR